MGNTRQVGVRYPHKKIHAQRGKNLLAQVISRLLTSKVAQRFTHQPGIGQWGVAVNAARRPPGRLRREGAYLAFIFFMLFALSIAATVLLVSFHPIEFDTAVVLSVSALTNTGPLAGTIALTPSFESTAGIASNPWQGWSGLATFPKLVLAGAMIVGRLETLAILALVTPDFWRR